MANTITTQVLNNGPRNLVLNVNIVGDASGDEASTLLVDASEYGATELRIDSVKSSLEGFFATLEWDATANVDAFVLPSGDSDHCFKEVGGIPNNAGAGVTGDIDISTSGLGAESGSFILWLVKK